MNEDLGLNIGIVRSTISMQSMLKLGGLGACPQENFKIRFFEIEFCGNFDYINLLANRLSNT